MGPPRIAAKFASRVAESYRSEPNTFLMAFPATTGSFDGSENDGGSQQFNTQWQKAVVNPSKVEQVFPDNGIDTVLREFPQRIIHLIPGDLA